MAICQNLSVWSSKITEQRRKKVLAEQRSEKATSIPIPNWSDRPDSRIFRIGRVRLHA